MVPLPNLVQYIIDAIPSSVAVLDSEGKIVLVNQAWRTFGIANHLLSSDFGLGLNYTRVWESAVLPDEETEHRRITDLKRIVQGDQALLEFEYPCHSPLRRRWFHAQFKSLSGIPNYSVMAIHQDISRWKDLEERTIATTALAHKFGGIERAPLSVGEIATLIAASDSIQDRTIVVSLLQTGIRPSELERIDASSLALGLPLLQIPESDQTAGRTVILPAAARSSLEALFAARETLPSRRQIERLVKSAGQRAALPRIISPLVLRHTYESILLQGAFDPTLVSHLLTGSVDASDSNSIVQITDFLDRFFRQL